jgi:hypothetical protein
MTVLSDDEVASSEEDYVAYAKSYKHQGAAAWLEDEGVFDEDEGPMALMLWLDWVI